MKQKPIPTDKAFIDSPEAGDPECLCSRCMQVIPATEVVCRWYDENTMPTPDEIANWAIEKGITEKDLTVVDVLNYYFEKGGLEFRYHGTCLGTEISMKQIECDIHKGEFYAEDMFCESCLYEAKINT